MQNVLNLMMTMKQVKMQQEQRRKEEGKEQEKWQFEQKKYQDALAFNAKEYALAERRVTSQEKRDTLYGESLKVPPKESEWEYQNRYADFLFKKGDLDKEGLEYFNLYRKAPPDTKITPKEEYDRFYAEQGRNQSYSRNKLTDIDRRIAKKKEPLGQTELMMKLIADDKTPVDIDNVGIQNLEDARAIFSRLELVSQDRLWNSDEKKVMKYLVSNIPKIEKEGVTLSKNDQTGETWILIGKEWVSLK